MNASQAPAAVPPGGLRRLAKEVAGYGWGSVLHRVVSVVVALVYPRILDQGEYGRLDVVFALMAMLSLVLILGLDIGLARLYYEQSQPERRRELTATAVWTVVLFGAVVAGVLLALAAPLAWLLYADLRYVPYLQLVLAGMPFLLLYNMQMLVLRLRQRVGTYNLLAVANLVIAALVSVYCVTVLGLGTSGVLWGVLISYIMTAAAGVLLNRSELPLRYLPDPLRKMLALGLPLIVAGVAQWALRFIDRLFLVRYVTDEDLALYAMADGIAGLLGLFMAAFQNAWGPFSFSIMGQDGAGRVYARTLTLLTAIGGGLVVGLTLFVPEVLLGVSLITEKPYGGAAASVGPLAVGLLFAAMYLVVQTGAHITKNTRVIALTTLLAAGVNIVLNFVIIPAWGIIGAAVATTLGYLTAAVALYIVAQRLAPIPYEPGKVIVSVAAIGALVALAPWLPPPLSVASVVLKVALLGLYAAVLLAARVVRWDEVRVLAGGVRRYLRRVWPQAAPRA